jgi:DNA-binding transcriptional ArsR family regulator
MRMVHVSARLPAVFGALADPTRLMVIERLVKGPASVSELARPFEMAGPSFLKHLKVLEDAGLVHSAKAGRVRTVTLRADALQWVEDWVLRHRRQVERRLDDLGSFLAKGKHDGSQLGAPRKLHRRARLSKPPA